MNCKGCMYLDYPRNNPKDGSGYCCQVERSSQRNSSRLTAYGEKVSAKVRFQDSERCELYKPGEFAERYGKIK